MSKKRESIFLVSENGVAFDCGDHVLSRRSPVQVLKKYEYVHLYRVISFLQTGISLFLNIFVKITRNCPKIATYQILVNIMVYVMVNGVIYEVYKNKDYG